MSRHQSFIGVLVTALCMPAFFTAGGATAGPITYLVTVDTSSISVQAGNLDFQFNPGDSSATAASVTITGFQTSGGVPASTSTLTGDASGTLPGPLLLDNGSPYNDIFQGFTYGTSLSFDLTVSGPAVDTPGGTVGSTFALSLYDDSGTTPLLTTDSNGSVLTLNLNANGTIAVDTFGQSPTNNVPVASATLSTAIPEPSSLALLASALGMGLPIFLRDYRRAKV